MQGKRVPEGCFTCPVCSRRATRAWWADDDDPEEDMPFTLSCDDEACEPHHYPGG